MYCKEREEKRREAEEVKDGGENGRSKGKNYTIFLSGGEKRSKKTVVLFHETRIYSTLKKTKNKRYMYFLTVVNALSLQFIPGL
jgi:hypothetical protein